jgi:hypothetical protein
MEWSGDEAKAAQPRQQALFKSRKGQDAPLEPFDTRSRQSSGTGTLLSRVE